MKRLKFLTVKNIVILAFGFTAFKLWLEAHDFEVDTFLSELFFDLYSQPIVVPTEFTPILGDLPNSTILLEKLASLPAVSSTRDSSAQHSSPCYRGPRIALRSNVHPLVSIVTPAKNANANLLVELAECILRQTLPAWEWLIIDDFSSDASSLDGMDSVAKLDERIRLIRARDHVKGKGHQSNVGRARNLGIKLAVAQYLLYVDSDDQVDPTIIEKMYWYLQTHPDAHFVNSYVTGFGAETYEWKRSVNPSLQFLTENIATVTALHRRSSLRAVNGYPDRATGLEDWDLWLRYANSGYWGSTIPELLMSYRRRATHGDRWKDFNHVGVSKFQNQIRQRYPRLVDKSAWPPEPKVVVPVMNVRSPNVHPLGQWSTERKHRIMFVVPFLVLGGAEHFLYVLAQGLSSMNWGITLVTTVKSDHPWLSTFQSVTSDIVMLDKIVPMTSYPEILINMIHVRQIDVVFISNSLKGYGLLPVLRAAYPHIVFADYCHMEEESWRQGGYARYSVALQPQLNAAFVASKRVKDWMVARGAEQAKIRVAYIGVDLNAWKPDPVRRLQVRRALNISGVAIVYACRLVNQKQPLLFAEAISQVLIAQRDQGLPYARVLIAGEGPLEKRMRMWLRARLGRSELNQIDFLGSVHIKHMYDLTLAADITVLPSIMEGIPTTFYESMAVGSVIVAAEVGAVSELVLHGKTGFLVSYSGIEEMSRKMQALKPATPAFFSAAKQYFNYMFLLATDGVKRSQMSAAGIKHVQNFSVHHTVSSIDRTLRNALPVRPQHQDPSWNPSHINVGAEAYRWALLGDHGEGDIVH